MISTFRLNRIPSCVKSPLRLKTTSASEGEISNLLYINRVNVLAVLSYYKLISSCEKPSLSKFLIQNT